MATSNILLHPYVTEKTMNGMTGTPTQDFKDGNRIEFVVLMSATKQQIKKAFEENFDVKVEKVWTKVTKKGKRATILLAEGYSAEDIGMRIGVF
ncbi:MAG: 50S ribosomal protein L23 [Euryarchaeota archaeon]|nr:50S ribosomal protein L23 [Euryarchaeota archaeon]